MYKFTICMPTYNRAYIIEKPLRSLVAQTYTNFEVLVVDDGSSDNTEEVVSQFREELNLRYIKKTNGGKHTALNTGIQNANGELFLILDSDDELVSDALENMNDIWDKCVDKTGICGIIGRCAANENVIGRTFPPDKKLISYVEFHYGKGGGYYGDCCECVRTDIMKNYRWPEELQTKFIPENYVFDQIGLCNKLIISETIFEIKEYQENGITLNYRDYIKKNIVGFLFAAISKIEIILPNANPEEISFHFKLLIWSRYWELVFIDKFNKGSRVKSVTFFGTLGFVYFLLRKFAKFLLHRN